MDRDGFVMGEGAGVFVFESLEHAMKRGAKIYGEYLGGAVTCDAHHMTDPRADGLGVSTCIELALKDAGIEREQVNYINAHATRCGGAAAGAAGAVCVGVCWCGGVVVVHARAGARVVVFACVRMRACARNVNTSQLNTHPRVRAPCSPSPKHAGW